jgi:triosephosphate isomerase (TIM)
MAGIRKPLISGNWKMNHNHFEALHCVEKLAMRLTQEDYARVDVSVHPPFTDIRTVQTYITSEKKCDLLLGAQHCHTEDKGAFTGEVSPAFLAKLEIVYVLCGHSERRQFFGETDEGVNAKVKAIRKNGMTPIMCVGETLEQREAGEAEAVVKAQIVAGLEKVKADDVATMVIAYEPIWAIGTGKTATAEDAQVMCAAVRAQVSESFGPETAMRVRIQYGGSAKSGNAAELMAQPDIDGLLVGGAALDPDEFAKIVTASHPQN